MKRYQRGDAGAGMVVVMVIMLVGLVWWGGMHGGGGGGHTGSRQHAAQMEKPPLELLDEAYARGEIAREEYLQRRSDLMQR